jgi:ubiquinone/menaquinone biosynthesis C-methylase UbiE
MILDKFVRDIQKKVEQIPGPSAYFYNIFIKRLLSKPELKIAKDVVLKAKQGVIVDLGSGTGYLSIEIAKRRPDLQIYGIDLSKKMVHIATHNAKGVKNIQFKNHNAADLPFVDDSIDFIVSTGSFHHWKYPVKVFNESYRVLKHNGEAWIYDGCYNLPDIEVVKLVQKYGFFQYLIFSRIQRLHGFDWEEYHTKIKSLLQNTKFKDRFQLDLLDGWMRISLWK